VSWYPQLRKGRILLQQRRRKVVKRRHEATSRPAESMFGSRGNYAYSRGPLQAASPRGIAGPLRHCGARDSLSLLPPPFNGPGSEARRAKVRGANGWCVGFLGCGQLVPLPTSYRVWESDVSSPCGVRGKAQPKSIFVCS